MARFDLHRIKGIPGYFLDCQADVLNHLNTRVVVPVQPPDMAPKPGARLNPIFSIGGEEHVMVTQFASALPVAELGAPVESLAHEHDRIMAALDMLLIGI